MPSPPSAAVIVLRAAVLGAATACALTALAGQGGRWNGRLDALNHLAPLWLVGGFLAVFLWMALGRQGRLTPVLGGAGALISLLAMAPDLVASATAKPARAEGQALKIVQFNVWQRNTDPAATVRWILAQDADVVVLEEATWRIYHPLKALYPYRTTCRVRSFCSTMILSKTPPVSEGGLGDADTPVPAAWATYMLQGRPFTLVGVHLEWPWPPARQQAQIRKLAETLNQFPKDSVVLAGDFNLTPWSFTLRRLDRTFDLQRRTHALFSWPAAPFSQLQLRSPGPLMPIDHVFAGTAWKTVDVARGPRLGSDHYPVAATLVR